MKTNNNDTGSIFVGTLLPTNLQVMGIPRTPFSIQIVGEAKPRPITYVMGSAKKGWHLCSKGTGKFEMGELEFTVIE